MNIIERVKNILLKPKEEWLVINNETASGIPLIITYLVPLAAAAAAASFIGHAFVIWYGSVLWGLLYAIILFLQLTAGAYVCALITDAFAPSFASEKNLNKSIQLVVYSLTPLCIGSLLNIIPAIGWLGSLAGGVYTIYLFFLGLPVLKKTPEDKVPIYLIVIILLYGVMAAILHFIFWRIFIMVVWAGVSPYRVRGF